MSEESVVRLYDVGRHRAEEEDLDYGDDEDEGPDGEDEDDGLDDLVQDDDNGVNDQADLPFFVWAGNTLHVNYTNGKSDSADMINVVEEETDNEEDTTCIMTGTFEAEDVPVSVTGCPGDTTFDVR